MFCNVYFPDFGARRLVLSPLFWLVYYYYYLVVIGIVQTVYCFVYCLTSYYWHSSLWEFRGCWSHQEGSWCCNWESFDYPFGYHWFAQRFLTKLLGETQEYRSSIGVSCNRYPRIPQNFWQFFLLCCCVVQKLESSR